MSMKEHWTEKELIERLREENRYYKNNNILEDKIMYFSPYAYIVKQGNCRVFNMHFDNISITFNVDYLPEEKEEWFCEVVGKQISNAVEICKDKAVKQLQSELRKNLGIGG